MYCQYGWYSPTFQALALRQRKKGFLSDEGPMLETLDYTIRIGSTPTFLYFDLYLYSAYAAHYVYLLTDVFWSLIDESFPQPLLLPR